MVPLAVMPICGQTDRLNRFIGAGSSRHVIRLASLEVSDFDLDLEIAVNNRSLTFLENSYGQRRMDAECG
jgi:hypothetical protein